MRSKPRLYRQWRPVMVLVVLLATAGCESATRPLSGAGDGGVMRVSPDAAIEADGGSIADVGPTDAYLNGEVLGPAQCRATPARVARVGQRPVALGNANLLALARPVMIGPQWPGTYREGAATTVGQPCGPDAEPGCTPSVVLVQHDIVSRHRPPVGGAGTPALFRGEDGSIFLPADTELLFIDEGEVLAGPPHASWIEPIPGGGALLGPSPATAWGHRRLGLAVVPPDEAVRDLDTPAEFVYVTSQLDDGTLRLRAVSRAEADYTRVLVEGHRFVRLRDLFGFDSMAVQRGDEPTWLCVEDEAGSEFVALADGEVAQRFRSPSPTCDDDIWVFPVYGDAIFVAVYLDGVTDLYRAPPEGGPPEFVGRLPVPNLGFASWVFDSSQYVVRSGNSGVFVVHDRSNTLYRFAPGGEAEVLSTGFSVRLAAYSGTVVARGRGANGRRRVIIYTRESEVLTLDSERGAVQTLFAEDGTVWLGYSGDAPRLVAVGAGGEINTYDGVSLAGGAVFQPIGTLLAVRDATGEAVLFRLHGVEATPVAAGTYLFWLSSKWLSYRASDGTTTLARWDGERLTPIAFGLTRVSERFDVTGDGWLVLETDGAATRLIWTRGDQWAELRTGADSITFLEASTEVDSTWAFARAQEDADAPLCICRMSVEALECIESPAGLSGIELLPVSGPRGPIGVGQDAQGRSLLWRVDLDWAAR